MYLGSKIRDPGSRKKPYSGSQIRGSKRHRIPDLQHRLKARDSLGSKKPWENFWSSFSECDLPRALNKRRDTKKFWVVTGKLFRCEKMYSTVLVRLKSVCLSVWSARLLVCLPFVFLLPYTVNICTAPCMLSKWWNPPSCSTLWARSLPPASGILIQASLESKMKWKIP